MTHIELSVSARAYLSLFPRTQHPDQLPVLRIECSLDPFNAVALDIGDTEQRCLRVVLPRDAARALGKHLIHVALAEPGGRQDKLIL